jgi:hypothetical protein
VNASIEKAHNRPSRDLLQELGAACNALPSAVHETARLARDRDRSALDRLERIAERAEGIRRCALLARQALQEELRSAPSLGR